MKKTPSILAVSVFAIIIIGGCAAENTSPITNQQTGPQTSANSQPVQGTTTAAVTQNLPQDQEKLPPAEPPKNTVQSEVKEAPASDADLAKLKEAYDAGDVARCDLIVNANLKKVCTENLQSITVKEETRPSEFKAISTPGTP